MGHILELAVPPDRQVNPGRASIMGYRLRFVRRDRRKIKPGRGVFKWM